MRTELIPNGLIADAAERAASMHLAVYETVDELFAHLIVSAARRRGHTARAVTGLREIPDVFVTPPTAIIMGVSQLDDSAIASVRTLRQSYADALIYIAAEAAGTRSTMTALEHGATDIVRKPILPGDLIARAELAAASRGLVVQSGAIHISDLHVDIDQAIANKAGHEMPLTRMELRLLYCLAQHHRRVAPTERLLTFARESDEFAIASLKTHISHLRQKLLDAGGAPFVIRARQMLGYILQVEDIGSTPGADSAALQSDDHLAVS